MNDQEKLIWQLRNDCAALVNSILQGKDNDHLRKVLEWYRLVEILKKLQ